MAAPFDLFHASHSAPIITEHLTKRTKNVLNVVLVIRRTYISTRPVTGARFRHGCARRKKEEKVNQLAVMAAIKINCFVSASRFPRSLSSLIKHDGKFFKTLHSFVCPHASHTRTVVAESRFFVASLLLLRWQCDLCNLTMRNIKWIEWNLSPTKNIEMWYLAPEHCCAAAVRYHHRRLMTDTTSD